MPSMRLIRYLEMCGIMPSTAKSHLEEATEIGNQIERVMPLRGYTAGSHDARAGTGIFTASKTAKANIARL